MYSGTQSVTNAVECEHFMKVKLPYAHFVFPTLGFITYRDHINTEKENYLGPLSVRPRPILSIPLIPKTAQPSLFWQVRTSPIVQRWLKVGNERTQWGSCVEKAN